MGMEGIPQGIDNLNNVPEQKHLKEGVRPIIASIRDWARDFNNEERAEEEKFIEETFIKSKDALEVNWAASDDEMKRLNLLNAGPLHYVISPVDERKKFTLGLYCCVSLIVVGKDKTTGKNISFLTHQVTSAIFSDSFFANLKKQLNEIKSRCEDGTVDAVIVGGDFEDDDRYDHQRKIAMDAYVDLVSLIGTRVQEVVDFEPIIINGPSAINTRDDVYFDTEQRRLYFFREKRNPKVGAFLPNQLDQGEEEKVA